MISVPQELKDFSMWLNPTNLRVFNKLEMIGLARKALKGHCESLDAEIQESLSQGLGDDLLGRGQFALRVYFYQLLEGGSFSLDLRPSRFEYHGQWRFCGEHLAFEFESELREALVETYKIYYHNRAEGLQTYLERMKLISPKWTAEDKAALEKIFVDHFNHDNATKQHFHLKDLVHSFSQIFFFIKERGGKVPSQFSLLGLYLTSLYMTLDEVKDPIDVKDCFMVAENLHVQ